MCMCISETALLLFSLSTKTQLRLCTVQTDYVLSTAEGREQHSHTALGPVGAGGRRAVDTKVRQWMGERRERELFNEGAYCS